MIRSMTGYGEAERETPAGRVRVEMRSVNHRFFSVNLRTPASLDRQESQLKEWLRAHLPRGHVNCTVRLEEPEASPRARFRLDERRAREYHGLLRQLRESLGLAGEVDLEMIARLPGVIEPVEDDAAGAIPADALRDAVDAAAREVVAMREEEGARLRVDLEQRIAAMEAAAARVEARAPERLAAERDRLRAAVAELAEGAGVDEDRLAREIAYLAERWDIGEELVRLRSHIALFREILDDDDPEPAGKRLGFVVQEMHRETNTIGSKANDAAIEHEVVGMKNEIERLREQVDNIE